MLYTIQVSNHPQAFLRVPTQAAVDSWETKYHGTIASAREARQCVDKLAEVYRHARVFRGAGTIGRLHYAVLRGAEVDASDLDPERWDGMG